MIRKTVTRNVARIVVLVLAAMLLAPTLPTARAQDGEDYTGEKPVATPIPNRAVTPGRGSNEISITMRSFGLGNVCRPGEWIGAWVEISDSADKVRNVLLRIADVDLDNDTALMQRVIVTNPGATQRVWLYLRLPYGGSSGAEFEITASEAVESSSAGDVQQYVPGRLLGKYPYQIGQRQTAPSSVGLIAVVGPRSAGLDQYKWVADTNGNFSVSGHELTEVIPSLSLAGLPDRWQGYSGLQALVWTSAASEDVTTNIRKDQADAIREWVQRGGHFIIVLPTVAQTWVAQPNNPLADIMPPVKVTRSEGVDLDRYRSLITRDTEAQLPKSTIVQSFTPENAGLQEAMPIMTGPDGEIVVIRRILGTGMVTVIGLDISMWSLQQTSHAFMADQFWNRILGKRLRVPTPAELDAGTKNKLLPNGEKGEDYNYSPQLETVDSRIAAAITNEGKAALGLLLAFVVFLAYWLLAGPAGFFMLKQRNWKQHAWVAFLAAAGAFTAISWTGANILKPRSVNGKHLTIVDGVYGQTTQRARSWIGLFLPHYGEQEVSVAPASTAGADWKNLLAAWDNPSPGGGAAWSTSFPDARGYVMDSRKPDTAAFPARATTKQIQVDWAGVLPADWGLPHPLADSSVPVGKEVRIVERKDAKPGERKWAIEGTLVHNLPAPMTNVWVIAVVAPITSQILDKPPGIRMFSAMSQANGKGEWAPETPLILDNQFDLKLGDQSVEAKFRELAPATKGLISDDYRSEFMSLATAFFDMLKPPDPHASVNDNSARVVLERTATHGMDLSRWFTQPCIIIVGELGENREDIDCPIPLRVDGIAGDVVRKRIKGRTIVRWVYPLDPVPVTTHALPIKPPVGDGTGSPGGTEP